MLTSAQIKKLPRGTYTNRNLNTLYPNHCKRKGKGVSLEYISYQVFDKETKKHNQVIGLKNRQQRRA